VLECHAQVLTNGAVPPTPVRRRRDSGVPSWTPRPLLPSGHPTRLGAPRILATAAAALGCAQERWRPRRAAGLAGINHGDLPATRWSTWTRPVRKTGEQRFDTVSWTGCGLPKSPTCGPAGLGVPISVRESDGGFGGGAAAGPRCPEAHGHLVVTMGSCCIPDAGNECRAPLGHERAVEWLRI